MTLINLKQPLFIQWNGDVFAYHAFIGSCLSETETHQSYRVFTGYLVRVNELTPKSRSGGSAPLVTLPVDSIASFQQLGEGEQLG